jgi:hypothetical protein
MIHNIIFHFHSSSIRLQSFGVSSGHVKFSFAERLPQGQIYYMTKMFCGFYIIISQDEYRLVLWSAVENLDLVNLLTPCDLSCQHSNLSNNIFSGSPFLDYVKASDRNTIMIVL